ncbi:hypothetical protein [Streptomonospora litoralis]|uniref:SpoVT-AbrB domain-containing protein n=1 Tax=Streptomonospora litoralis TaxID=2498135 RepID=A0A4P6Q4U1_9ACTN|nr:hypothetical protein [Streptomonospora litoralis]QBI55726.1 hypothetical protein EKD16_19815 [Streptomonospora litoralis]
MAAPLDPLEPPEIPDKSERIGFAWPLASRCAITLPTEVWEWLGLDRPDAVVDVLGRAEEIVLRPRVAVHPDDAWFWEEGQQQAEREVEAEISAGGVGPGMAQEEFLAHLDRLSSRRSGDPQ